MKAQTQALFVCTLLLSSMTMFMSKVEASGPINVVYSLSGSPSFPIGSLVADSAGNLYGTSELTDTGRGCGAVFKLTPQSGGGWQFNVIHTFTENDGCQPVGGLVIDAVGNLCGTTTMGGAYGGGTVFVLQPKATGWSERVLYNFVPFSTSDVFAPFSSLAMDTAGNLYGTAASGGTTEPGCGGGGCGGVFKISRAGTQFTETVLYNFTGGLDGGNPLSSLTFDAAGNLYGTTEFWGAGSGTVFELSPSNNSEWNETTLYSFTGGADGGMPEGGVVFDAAGNLYGMTNRAGDFACNSSGCGTVFQLSPQGNGDWQLNILLTFHGPNGADPGFSNLVFDSAGNLYGTAPDGGKNNDGVVFRLSRSSVGWTQRFASFNGKDGALPYGPVLLNNGFLYGTASHGGSSNHGVVFSIKL